MKLVADLMTRNVLSLRDNQTLKEAHALIRDKGIRHIPIVDAQDNLVGVLSQRPLLAFLLQAVDSGGLPYANKLEARTLIRELMEEPMTIAPEQPLITAGSYLLDNKQACLVVTEGGKVTGILSPVDFIRCALHFLEAKN
ncbi:CBS domain-containing protein [Permianibacter sp. IMCC34836]|uniref:CBS domain-containing protein n=1 Tax=Permianibacter fluminis TaxID=2738515 RepID=UPI0015546414|nr:CBS domain-containing protein [Permianibacter fluminis]NQD37056.1 CBS domain-containing protein [Permianibacter fluminis]